MAKEYKMAVRYSFDHNQRARSNKRSEYQQLISNIIALYIHIYVYSFGSNNHTH